MGKSKRLDLLKKTSLHNVAKVEKPKADNPFDKFANSRKKFDILNRKVKGEDRNVGRARAKAVDERKKKLLAEIGQSKKSNVMVDKRFGESDPTMSVEEKMFLRFQKERLKKVRNSSMYNLDEENEEFLTHKGSILGESNIMDTEWVSDEDEQPGKIHKDIVNKLHFGGGLVQKKTDPDEEIIPQAKKSRLDALQEIVMKSKLFKMQKKEAKEEQESERKRLDEEFDQLFANELVSYEDKSNKKKKDLLADLGVNREKKEKSGQSQDDDMDEYDRDMHAMMFEPKVQPSDRTKTAEEIALETREKMEELEKQRLRRMKLARTSPDDEADMKKLSKRKRNDDELDDMDFGKDRKAKMNESAKNARQGPGSEDEGEEDDEDDEEGEGSDEEGEEDSYEDYSEDSEEEGDEEDEDEEEGDDFSDEFDEEEEGEDDDEEGEDDDEEEEVEDDEADNFVDARGKVRSKRSSRKKSSDKVVESNEPIEFEEMPHKLPCPQTIEEFDRLIRRHCKNYPEDKIELTKRIISWNSVHLPGEQGKENKTLMHNFLNVLIKYFIRLGDSLVQQEQQEEEDNNAIDIDKVFQELNSLTQNIFQLTQDLQQTIIPLYSRTLKILYEQFQKSNRDYQQGILTTSIPSLGKLFFFQLIGHLFSVSDLHNHIVNLSILMLTQILTQCSMNSITDIYSGLLICDILLTSFNSTETKKLIPEVISFVTSLIALYLPKFGSYFPETPATPTTTMTAISPLLQQLQTISNPTGQESLMNNLYYNKDFYQQFKHFLVNNIKFAHFKNVREIVSSSSDDNSSKFELTELLASITYQWDSYRVLFHQQNNNDNNQDMSKSFYENILAMIYKLILTRLIPYYSSYAAFPELIHPIYSLLKQLAPHQAQPFPFMKSLQFLHLQVLEQLSKNTSHSLTTRIPLLWREKQSQFIESKNPKYHINYIIKRDREEYDQDNKEKSQLKQLTRQLKREQKAAMRELRRDADFIEQEKYKEKQALLEKQRAERQKNYQWLEEQQATINLQVKKGGELMKGGGSFVAKKPRVKR